MKKKVILIIIFLIVILPIDYLVAAFTTLDWKLNFLMIPSNSAYRFLVLFLSITEVIFFVLIAEEYEWWIKNK